MRSWMWVPAALVALVPSSALAVLQLNTTRPFFIRNGQPQVLMMDVFVTDLDNTDEQLTTWAVAVDAPANSPSGIRFLPPEPVGAEYPYVFKDLLADSPESGAEDFGSTFNRMQVSGALPGAGDDVNVVNGVNQGLFRIPIFVPANPPPGFYPISIDVSSTDFAGSGGPIIAIVGTTGGIFIPEPSAAALACVAGVALLRRRRGPG